MRKLVLKLHLVLAVAAGAFLAVFSITGSIMAFEPELDHLLHARVSYVTPRGAPKALAELGAEASRAMHGERVTGYLLSASPDLSYQLLFRGRAVFVNQYTGDVLGMREPGPDFLARVHQLHLRLLVQNRSDAGKAIMTWAGAALLVLLFTGLYLWWPLKRVTIGAGSGRRFWFDFHNAAGIFSFVFLLAIAVTGVVIGFDDEVVPMIYKATRSAPKLMYARPQPSFTVTPSGTPIGPDRAVEIARATLPGAAPISVTVPPPTGVYTISARYPEDLTPGGRTRIVIDQYSGDVLASEGSRTAPPGSRVITLNRAIHTGDVFGMPSKIIMSLASFAVIVQLVSGLLLWWRKRRPVRAAC
jgi:uncharacterized iron-regulated membrane protein